MSNRTTTETKGFVMETKWDKSWVPEASGKGAGKGLLMSRVRGATQQGGQSVKYASKRWHYREREAGGVGTLACGSLPREQIGSALWRLREKPSKVHFQTRSVYNFRGPQLPGRGHLGEVWEGGPQSRRKQNTSRSPDPKMSSEDAAQALRLGSIRLSRENKSPSG